MDGPTTIEKEGVSLSFRFRPTLHPHHIYNNYIRNIPSLVGFSLQSMALFAIASIRQPILACLINYRMALFAIASIRQLILACRINYRTLVQPSMVSEYDLGGEGDLFKAPQVIIQEEALLSLDPVAAACSMMNQTIKDAGIQNDALLSEVLYECEKELMEKSAIEETISELMDVKIPMLQAEQLPAMENEKRSIPECSLQKSVSSGCLNSADWMNGAVRPNFLDFQGLDFEAAFGLRRAYSEGDIQV
jgi:hypothetical protein